MPREHTLHHLPDQTETAHAGLPRTVRVSGLQSVRALFKRSPERVLRLFYEDRLVPEVRDFCIFMAQARRPYRKVSDEELAKVAGTLLHGGIVAVAEPRQIIRLDPGEACAWAHARQPLVVLDGIGNPNNLGAIARTLAFFGFRRMVLSDHPGQSGLTDSAFRVAEGGLDCLDIYRARDLPAVLRSLKPAYRIVGTALSKRGLALEALRGDPRPVALILGNEEHGLSRAILEACDTVVTLPGSGAIQSLNVAATAAILAHELSPLRRYSERAGERSKKLEKPGRRHGKPGQ